MQDVTITLSIELLNKIYNALECHRSSLYQRPSERTALGQELYQAAGDTARDFRNLQDLTGNKRIIDLVDEDRSIK